MKVIALLLGVLLLIFIIANAKDDELRPEVKEALNWQVPADAFDKDNGYVLLHGMYAPIGQDPYLAGKAILENELARYKEFQKTKIEPAIIEGHKTNPFAQWHELQCKYSTTQNCLDFYIQNNSVNITALLDATKPQTERLAALKASKNFDEINIPLLTYLLPPFQVVIALTEIERVSALQEIAQGKLEAGINRLAENNQYSRKLLKNSKSIISHMIAISSTHRDARLLSEILIKYPEASQYRKQIQSILLPITNLEYSLEKAFIAERSLQLSIVESIPNQPFENINSLEKVFSWMYALSFWLPNSTQNLFYDWGTMRVELASIEANQLKSKAAEIANKQTESLGIGYNFMYLRNPIGKILISIAEPAFNNYFERHHDLDGYLTLVRLQHRLIADKVTKELLPQILPQYPNPYTLEPMRLDNQNGFIVFDGRQPSNSNFNKSSSYQIVLPH